MTFVLNCTKFKKKSREETQDICGHFCAFFHMWRHTFSYYQLISRQISKQPARSYKTKESYLKQVTTTKTGKETI